MVLICGRAGPQPTEPSFGERSVPGDDAQLAKRFLDGEEEAFCELVRRHQGVVFALCYRMLGHRHDAEDAAQDVFCRLYRNLRRYDLERPLRPWLLTIAANCCRSALQRRNRRPSAMEFIPGSAADRAQPAPQIDLAEELQSAIESLKPDHRLCFILYYQQELSVMEVAEILDKPEGTVKTWLHRARKEVARLLERRGVAPPEKTEHTSP